MDFFANDKEDTHCMQACYQMVVARLRNVYLGMHTAEDETGYQEGKLTWPYAMFMSLSRQGLYVKNHEDSDIDAFIEDPLGSLRRQITDEDAIRYQIENSNLELEVDRARVCRDNPSIEFKIGTPTLEDLSSVILQGAEVICLINGAILTRSDGYRPHFIMVRSVGKNDLIIDDPGPPPAPELRIDKATFLRAWTDPSPTVANYIACSRTPLQ